MLFVKHGNTWQKNKTRKEISIVITRRREIFTKNGLEAWSQNSCSDTESAHPTLQHPRTLSPMKIHERNDRKILPLHRAWGCSGYNWHVIFWETHDSYLSRRPATVSKTSTGIKTSLEQNYVKGCQNAKGNSCLVAGFQSTLLLLSISSFISFVLYFFSYLFIYFSILFLCVWLLFSLL